MLEGLSQTPHFNHSPFQKAMCVQGKPWAQLSVAEKKNCPACFGVNSKLPCNFISLSDPPVTLSPSSTPATHPEVPCYHTSMKVIHPAFFLHIATALAVSISSRDGLGTANLQEDSPRAMAVCVWVWRWRKGKAKCQEQ